MKRRVLLGAMLLLTIGLIGCGKDSQESTEPSTVATTEAASTEAEPTEKETEADEQVETEPVDDMLESYTSELGYSVYYNSDMFEVSYAENTDRFILIGQDLENEVPAYVAIQKADDTAENVVGGLALQPGRDDIEVNMATFGAGGFQATSLTYQEDTERGVQYMTFQVVETADAVYIIEICNGDNIDDAVTGGIEHILGTFTVE